MELNRHFFRGAAEVAAEQGNRKERRRVLRLLDRPGVLALTLGILRDREAAAELGLAIEPPEDRSPGGWLAWIINNWDEIAAFIEKIAKLIESLFGSLPT